MKKEKCVKVESGARISLTHDTNLKKGDLGKKMTDDDFFGHPKIFSDKVLQRRLLETVSCLMVDLAP